MGKRKVISKFKNLRQAVESFLIADATCSREDAYEAYVVMVKAANLAEYLPHEESTKS